MKNTSGLTLLELAIAIGVILLVLGTFGSLFLNESERKTCNDQLNNVQTAVALYRASSGDHTLCKNARSLVIKYNETCGEDLGKLSVPKCE
ncbi:MAG: hypothetical protein JYX80_00755 [Candidatus Scalindua sediminis]|nr:hypothetical protein [Candidatus Scalindua sediminis]